MKLSIRFISIAFILILPLFLFGGITHALSAEHLLEYSIQEIEFYDEDQCGDSGSGGNCGNTAKEIYWSALSNTFGPVQAAGIFGNIMNEGGFNPVSVESCTGNNPFDFKSDTWRSGWSAQEFTEGNKTTGVGSFGITWERYKYFDFIEEKNGKDLIDKYFLHPELYSFGGCSDLSVGSSETGGDALKAAIGDTDFNRLVSIEVEYMLKMLSDSGYGFDMDKFKAITSPEDAAEFFSMNYEKCQGCTVAGSAENQERRAAAKKAADEMQDFKCSGGGTFKGQGYNLTDGQLIGLVKVAQHENGCNLKGIKDELSLMANRADNNPSAGGVVGYVRNTTWFAARVYYNESKDGVSDEELEAARDVLNNGNRTVPLSVDEHDCVGDLTQVETDGKVTQAASISPGHDCGNTGLEDQSLYVSGKTKITNEYGATYLFYDFAGGPDDRCGDPFGATSGDFGGASASSGGGTSTSGSSGGGGSSSSSSGTASQVTPSKITLIGDSISVMSENALKAKFPDSTLNMVVSRHSTSKGTCSGDEGGLSILEKFVKGSGSVITQHADGNCETVNITSDMMNDTVVWELGTNSIGATEGTINKVIEQVGSNRKLYLVTPYDGTSNKDNADKIAQMYRDVASKHDNVYIVDWNKAVRDSEDKYIVQSDHVHPTEEGQKLLADLISQASGSSSVCSRGSVDDFVAYYQMDPPWGQESWGGHGTIEKCGCSSAAFAMIATALSGHEINPSETTKTATDLGLIYMCGGDDNLVRKLAEHYGFETETLYDEVAGVNTQEVIQKVSQYLKDGWMIEVSGQTPTRDDTYAPFRSTGGHFLALRGIDEKGDWLIGNSSKWTREPMDSFRSWPPESIAKYMHHGVVAIRGTGTITGNSNCEAACGGESTSSGLTAGGLDKAAADALMEEYKNSNAQELVNKGWIPGVNCNGGPLSNCVAFSQYFIHKYTTKGDEVGGLPNGSDVVGTLIAHGFPDGGTTPKPYAIFSTESGVTMCGSKLCGHTGVVLNVDTANNKILIGEAGCSSDASWTGAHEYDLSTYTSGAYTYAYTDGFLTGL